jgi:hypothetical protein
MPQMMTTRDRALAGVIVTFVNVETGELRVEHRAGYHYQVTSLPAPDAAARSRHPEASERSGRADARLSDLPSMILSRSTRKARQRARETHTMNVHETLRRLCSEADGWEGDWRVRTICTPQSILADLRGRERVAERASPEQWLLSRIGRLDLWEHSGERQ